MQNIYTGFLSTTSKGDGYVKIPDLDWESVFVEGSHINKAFHGDQVEVEIVGKNQDGQKYGKILSIIERAKKSHAGLLKEENGIYVFVPHDKKTYTNFLIKKEDAMNAEPNTKVAAVITDWQSPKEMPWAKVIRVLGKPGENNAEMLAYAIERGFSDEHFEASKQQADELQKKGITEKDITGRRDFRNTLTFTIDPADAKDFDDAISFKEVGDGKYEIGIHIADVSHYVTPDSALDGEAIERQTSVYLVDRVIPMLPEGLSNDLCSLVPNQDRLVMSAVFVIDDNMNISDEWYGKSVIHSARRFSYEEAQEIIDGKSQELHKEMTALNNLAKKFKDRRFAEGALSLDSEEVKFKLDENGKPVDVYVKVRGDSNKMIEELMLLANRKVSEFITLQQKIKEPICVYRVHDRPDADKMHDLELYLRALGFRVRFEDGSIPSQDLNDVLKKLEDNPAEKDLVQSTIARTMQKAVYSTNNVGHYGLAFKFYSHFTSPIRRYPDVLTHRILQRVLTGEMPKQEEKAPLEKMCLHASRREKEASDAERGSIKYKQVEYMSDRIGQEFEGIISGASEWGVYVAEKKSKCEGMIRLRDLGTDFYIFDSKSRMIIGERTNETFRIGDRVKIKVKKADLEERQIDYVLVR
jgi:ribonuclease R